MSYLGLLWMTVDTVHEYPKTEPKSDEKAQVKRRYDLV